MASFLAAALLVVSLSAGASERSPATGRAAVSVREQVTVSEVLQLPTEDFVVLLATRGEPVRILGIRVGVGDAFNVKLRIERLSPPRPTTLNLLEGVLTSGNMRMLDATLSSVSGGRYVARVRLRQQGRTWTVEAQPGDAIGLAVGLDVPIWVATELLERDGFLMTQGGLDARTSPQVKYRDSW